MIDTYKKAFIIACELMTDCDIYGVTKDILVSKILERDGSVCSLDCAKLIIRNLDRFSDDDEIRNKAIERLGW